MKVSLVVHQFFPRHYTGTERVTLNLAKQLQRMGHRVRVFTYGMGDDPVLFTEHHGSTSRREYSFEGVPVTAVIKSGGRTGGPLSTFDLDIESVFTELLAIEQPDVVHIVHAITLASAADAARKLSIPFVMTLTDYWLMCPRIQLIRTDDSVCFGPDGGRRCADGICFPPTARQEIETRLSQMRDMFDHAAAIVTPSRFVASMLISNGFDSQAIRVIRHGMDYRVIQCAEPSPRASGDVVFGFAGTIAPTKGVHDLVDAWKTVTAPNAKLEIHGGSTGPDAYLQHVQDTSRSDQRITFHGKYEYDDIGRILNSIDVLILPSRFFETSSLVTASAFAHRVPVIAQNMGAPPEIVTDKVNGYTFTPGDSQGIARIVNNIATNPEILQELRSNIVYPPRIEEEALAYQSLYSELTVARSSQAPGSVV